MRKDALPCRLRITRHGLLAAICNHQSAIINLQSPLPHLASSLRSLYISPSSLLPPGDYARGPAGPFPHRRWKGSSKVGSRLTGRLLPSLLLLAATLLGGRAWAQDPMSD